MDVADNLAIDNCLAGVNFRIELRCGAEDKLMQTFTVDSSGQAKRRRNSRPLHSSETEPADPWTSLRARGMSSKVTEDEIRGRIYGVACNSRGWSGGRPSESPAGARTWSPKAEATRKRQNQFDTE
jgi:hypothetical protein